MSRKNRKSDLSFYADECIPQPSVDYLRSNGISVTHAFDLGFIERPDRFHLKESKKMKRILLSLDADFIHFSPNDVVGHPGVICLSSSDITPKHLNKLLDKVLKNINSSAIKNSILTISIDKIRKNKKGIITLMDI